MPLTNDMWSQRDLYLVNTTPYAVEYNGSYIVDASGGARTINLPTAVGANGMFVRIKKFDSSTNKVTIDANGSETIDGALTFVQNDQYDSVTLVSYNGNWIREFGYTPNSTPSGQKIVMIAQFSQGQGAGYTPFAELGGSYPTYAVAGSLWFGGTTLTGTPGRVVFVCGRSGTKAATSSYIQIWDVTNSLEVCVANFTNNLQHLETITTLTNLPTAAAIWDIRMADAGSNPPTCRIYSASIL